VGPAAHLTVQGGELLYAKGVHLKVAKKIRNAVLKRSGVLLCTFVRVAYM